MELAALGMMQGVKLLRFLSLVSCSFAVVADVEHVSTAVAVAAVDEVEGAVVD